MRNIVIVIAMFFITSSFSQTINGVPFIEIDTPFVQIVGTSRLMSNKINVEIDFGQNTKFFGNTRKESAILDADGKQLKFNSMIDALNFMTKIGYKFEQAYAFADQGSNQNVYHFLLSKIKD